MFGNNILCQVVYKVKKFSEKQCAREISVVLGKPPSSAFTDNDINLFPEHPGLTKIECREKEAKGPNGSGNR
jgi:hypothetical protein